VSDGHEREDYLMEWETVQFFNMGVSVLGKHDASIFRMEQIETVVMYQITTQRDTQEDRRISKIFEKSTEQCFKEYRA
jgi:hypothetical protein